MARLKDRAFCLAAAKLSRLRPFADGAFDGGERFAGAGAVWAAGWSSVLRIDPALVTS